MDGISNCSICWAYRCLPVNRALLKFIGKCCVWLFMCYRTYLKKQSSICFNENRTGGWTELYLCACCVCVLPERGKLSHTDRLDVDLCLSVEASSCVCQPDGVDFTLGGRVSHHHPVHCCICLTVIHTYSACENNKPHKMRQALSHNQHLSYWEVTAKTKVVPFFRFNKKMTKLTKLVLWKHVFPKLFPSELFYPYNTSDKIKSEHKKKTIHKNCLQRMTCYTFLLNLIYLQTGMKILPIFITVF